MVDEMTSSQEETVTGETAEAPAAPRRDIIAERMAQRMKEQEANPSSRTDFSPSEPPEETHSAEEESTAVTEEAPKPPRKILSFQPKQTEPIEAAEEHATAPAPIDGVIADATEAMETSAPPPMPREEREAPRRNRDRAPNRDRFERREPRQPRPERVGGEMSELPRIQRDRPSRPERPERKETDHQQKDQRPAGKIGDSTFNRAKALASKLGVSVVIPLYNEQESLRELTAALREELFKLCEKSFQIIYVNDGSTDRSGEILKDIVAGTSKVTTLSFRSNLGKSAALSVGFKEAKYGIVITMDSDLQDDPKELVNLIAKLDEGYDLVSGWKKKRHDPISKTVPSKLFNSVTSFFAGIKLHDFNCGLKAYRKQVTDQLDVYGEMHRYLPALAHWQGFRVTEIPVVHHPRRFGKSKFGSSRFFKGFLDLLSIVFTNRYGKRPLHLFGTIGTLMTLIGLAINIYVSIEWAHGIPLSNRPILLLGILLMMVGVQLLSIGLLGEMIVKNSAKGYELAVVKDKRPPRTGQRPGGEERGARPARPGVERRSRGPVNRG